MFLQKIMKKKKLLKMVKKVFARKKSRVGKIVYYSILLLLFLFASYNLYFSNKTFPGVYVTGIYIGNKTETEIVEALKNATRIDSITIKNGEKTYEIETSSLNHDLNIEKTAKSAVDYFRTGNIFVDIKRRLLIPITFKNFGFAIDIDKGLLEETIKVISSEVDKKPTNPRVFLENDEVVVDIGTKGESVDSLKLASQIENNLSLLKRDVIQIEKKEVNPTISQKEADALKQRGEIFLERSLSLKFEYDTFYYNGQDFLSFLKPKGEYWEEEVVKITTTVSEKVNRNSQDSIFNFSGGKVVEFTPSKEGIEVDTKFLANSITNALKNLEKGEEEITIEIPVNKTSPSVTNKEVNDLGINTLIGRGTSRYRGSISSRIYNIGLSSSKFNGVLIKPGETFSFNNTVGEIDALTGYKQAYVIQDGATVLGDGGGVCQVSTTLFRAALDAGLPIVDRRAHSYRVGYYEQDGPVGYDATIYVPTTDFKFKNDTPKHLLIQTLFDPGSRSLVFEIYGTDDGRSVSVSKPVVWDVTAPPEDLYIDDPTKPVGEIEQIDYKAWGAKAKFDYFVERDGEILQDRTFYSTYRPWQAKFLRGTGGI